MLWIGGTRRRCMIEKLQLTEVMKYDSFTCGVEKLQLIEIAASADASADTSAATSAVDTDAGADTAAASAGPIRDPAELRGPSSPRSPRE